MIRGLPEDVDDYSPILVRLENQNVWFRYFGASEVNSFITAIRYWLKNGKKAGTSLIDGIDDERDMEKLRNEICKEFGRFSLMMSNNLKLEIFKKVLEKNYDKIQPKHNGNVTNTDNDQEGETSSEKDKKVKSLTVTVSAESVMNTNEIDLSSPSSSGIPPNRFSTWRSSSEGDINSIHRTVVTYLSGRFSVSTVQLF